MHVMLKWEARHISLGNKMVMYKCLECQKEVKWDQVKKRVRCPYCGSKILYKPKEKSSVIEAI